MSPGILLNMIVNFDDTSGLKNSKNPLFVIETVVLAQAVISSAYCGNLLISGLVASLHLGLFGYIHLNT